MSSLFPKLLVAGWQACTREWAILAQTFVDIVYDDAVVVAIAADHEYTHACSGLRQIPATSVCQI